MAKYKFQKYDFKKLFAEKGIIHTNNWISNTHFGILKNQLKNNQALWIDNNSENKEDYYKSIVNMLDGFKVHQPIQNFTPEKIYKLYNNGKEFNVVFMELEEKYIGIKEEYYNLINDLNLEIKLISKEYGQPLGLYIKDDKLDDYEKYVGIVLPCQSKEVPTCEDYLEYTHKQITEDEEKRQQKKNEAPPKEHARLKKFIGKDKYKPEFMQVYETENFLTACDGYKMAVLFKDKNNKSLDAIVSNENYQNYAMNVIKFNYENKLSKNAITLDTVSTIEILESIKKEIKDFTKLDALLRIEAKENLLELSSRIEGEKLINYLPEIRHETQRNIKTNTNSLNGLYACNLQYLLDILKLTKSKQFTMYFPEVNVNPFIVESEDMICLLLPVRIKSDEDIIFNNQERERREQENQQKEEEEKIKEEQKQKEYEVKTEEQFKNNEYIDSEQLLLLCKKYDITIPLKTHGYINKKLHSCTKDGKIRTCGKNTSNSIWEVIDNLKNAICQEVTNNNSEGEAIFSFSGYKET